MAVGDIYSAKFVWLPRKKVFFLLGSEYVARSFRFGYMCLHAVQIEFDFLRAKFGDVTYLAGVG